MLRVLGRAVRREPLFRRGHRHRRAQGQRSVAAGAELGAVPGLGKRPLRRSVAALFFGEPVLGVVVPALSRDPTTNLSVWQAVAPAWRITIIGGYGSRLCAFAWPGRRR